MSNLSEMQKTSLGINNVVEAEKSTTSLNRVRTEDNRREETFNEMKSQALDQLIDNRSPIMNKNASKNTSIISAKHEAEDKKEETKGKAEMIYFRL
jgi:hypothetical protein